MGLRNHSTVDARQRFAFAGLVALTVALVVLSELLGPTWSPPGLAAVSMLLGGLLLRVGLMRLLLGVVAAGLGFEYVRLGPTEFRPGNVVLLLVVGWLSWQLARRRDELGLPGLRGEGMLVELRDRLRIQGELPPLPSGWRAEVVQTSAGGASFGGDFMVSSRTGDGRRLELALVDVSGKGVDAGTRALQLSGALGGLLGAVPPEQFLPAANDYIRRQEWQEGFATAVHVAIALDSGEYLLESAGHPPAAQFKAGSGKWQLSTAGGSVLGFFETSTWKGERGRLGRGDALLLYTDGRIEVPGRDLGLGVDQLLGEANRLVVTTFEHGASKLIEAVAPDAMDDRALVLLWRT